MQNGIEIKEMINLWWKQKKILFILIVFFIPLTAKQQKNSNKLLEKIFLKLNEYDKYEDFEHFNVTHIILIISKKKKDTVQNKGSFISIISLFGDFKKFILRIKSS
jgi:hypothetical protein